MLVWEHRVYSTFSRRCCNGNKVITPPAMELVNTDVVKPVPTIVVHRLCNFFVVVSHVILYIHKVYPQRKSCVIPCPIIKTRQNLSCAYSDDPSEIGHPFPWSYILSQTLQLKAHLVWGTRTVCVCTCVVIQMSSPIYQIPYRGLCHGCKTYVLISLGSSVDMFLGQWNARIDICLKPWTSVTYKV